MTARWEGSWSSVSLEAPLPDLAHAPGTEGRNYLAARRMRTSTTRWRPETPGALRIAAPFDGQVTGANADPGTIVTPRRAVERAELGDFELEAGVPAARSPAAGGRQRGTA
ncbi:MAG: hypothetical protein R2810_06430 [Flavobacteriales bacterium]